MKIRAAPCAFLLAARILSPPHFGTVLTLPYEPCDCRVLENPRIVLRQGRYSRADATYGDDKNGLREHLSLQLTSAPCTSQSSTANWGSRRSVPDSELTASQRELGCARQHLSCIPLSSTAHHRLYVPLTLIWPISSAWDCSSPSWVAASGP